MVLMHGFAGVVVLAGFAAAGLSLGAAITVVNGPDVAAPWLFELSLLLMAHWALRTVWILRELIVVVRNEDMVWGKEKAIRQVKKGRFDNPHWSKTHKEKRPAQKDEPSSTTFRRGHICPARSGKLGGA